MLRGDGREEPGAVAKRPKGPVESKWLDYMEEQLGEGEEQPSFWAEEFRGQGMPARRTL